MKNELKPLSKSGYKKIFPDMANEIDKIDIYLTIDNIDFDPDEITKRTGLKPDEIYKKGLEYILKNGKKYIPESNYWSVKYSHENMALSEEAINGFVEQIINPNKEYFKKIFNKGKGRLEFIYYYYRSNNMGIVFEENFVKILSELNLEIDFDLYCCYED
jgi:predicted metal-dependent phosphoesterase TrpH